MKAHRRLWLGLAVLAIAAVASAALALRGRNPALPEFDSSGMSPEAARPIARAREAVAGDPASALAWGRLGMAYMAHDFRDQALCCFAEAAARQPRQFRWPYLTAILLEDSDPERAEQSYSAARALKPDYAPLHWRLGQFFLRLDRLEAAQNEFETAARLDRDSLWPLLGRAHVALARGDEIEARRRLETAVERAAWSRDAHSELAGVLRRLGLASAAWEHQQEASRLPPGPREMPDEVRNEILQYAARARSLALEADELTARGKLAQAAGVLRQLVADSPDRSRPRVNLGQLLLAQRDFAGARDVFRETIERFPGEALAHYGLASALEAAGEGDLAIDAYRRAGQLKPDYAEAHFRLGILLWQRKDVVAAAASLERAVSTAPELAPAHLALGLVLKELGEGDRAVEQVRLAVRLAPNDPEPAKRLAELLGGKVDASERRELE